MNHSETRRDDNDEPSVEDRPPAKPRETNGTAVPADSIAGSGAAGRVTRAVCDGTVRKLPPGQHPYDPVKKDLDPIGFALSRVQTFLVWIGEHRAAFEKYRHTDPELAESELSNLRDSISQGRIYLQRLSELLLAGYTIDPQKRLPESLRRGWFSSFVSEIPEGEPAVGGGHLPPGGREDPGSPDHKRDMTRQSIVVPGQADRGV